MPEEPVETLPSGQDKDPAEQKRILPPLKDVLNKKSHRKGAIMSTKKMDRLGNARNCAG